MTEVPRQDGFPTAAQAKPAPGASGQAPAGEFRGYAFAAAAVIAGLACSLLIRLIAGPDNINLVFLLFVIAIAIRYGLGPSFVGSVLSVLAINFFFLAPLYTLEVADPANLVTLFLFMIVALVTSHLAARARSQAIAARKRAEEAEALYRFSRRLSELMTLEELLQATLDQVTSMLSLEGTLLLRGVGGEVCSRTPGEHSVPIDAIELAVVQASWSREVNEREVMRVGDRFYFPLRTSHGGLGSIGVRREWVKAPLTIEERQLLGAVADQAAVAIERVLLAAERDEARVAAEKERLRSMLLASLSHDLKTPLASITGAVTALRQFGQLYDAAARDDLAAMIQDEAERLARFVGNLLDMARLEAGGLRPNLQAVDVGDLIGTALQRTESLLREFETHVAVDGSLPMLNLDPVLFEQVLVNLLDNAARYAPIGSTIEVSAALEADCVALTVADEGPGIPPEDRSRVFDKFYRSEKGDRQQGGTGLGLAICRGFVTALGGAITVANRDVPASGAVFTIRFPKAAFAALPQQRVAP